jgi:prolyl-tRNA synthetase
MFKKAGIRAKLDTRDKTPGEKFYYWEMKGVPIRIEIGPRDVEKGEITLVRRDTGERMQVKSNLIEEIEALGAEIAENLKSKSEEDLRSRIKDAATLDEAAEIVAKKMVVRAPFCSRDMDGLDCAEVLKGRCDGALVRGTLFPEPERPGKKACIVCGKPAREIVYIAKAY